MGLDGADDLVVWRYARVNGYAILTKDEDFANRVALEGPPPKVLWLRTGNTVWRDVLLIVRKYEAAIHRFLEDPDAGCLELR